MKIENNPIDRLLLIFEKEYPNQAKNISRLYFGKVDKGFACTLWNDDGISIVISPIIKKKKDITFVVATELLAHELAHVVAGYDAGHNEEWEKHFYRLFELYEKSWEIKENKDENS